MQGSVRKRGKKWYYYFDTISADGKRKKIERVGGNTKKDALKALRLALDSFELGIVEPNNLTVEKYLSEWLEDYIRTNRKINTYNRYRGVINNNILPSIGNIKLNKLQPIYIEKLLANEKEKGLSGTSLQNIYGTLNSSLNRAVRLKILRENPCQFVERPKREKPVINVLSVEEFQNILATLDTSLYNDYIFDLALKIVLELGLRRGELSGLEWSNVQDNTLTITNNLIYSHGKTYLETPKTEDSERTLYISDNLKNLLSKHKTIQSENRLRHGPHYLQNIYNDRNYNFVMTWENGRHIHPMYYTQKFKKLLKRSDINKHVRFHDLRHTNASLLLSQGVDFKTIQTRLGHADINTTLNIYSHVNLEMQKNATEKLTNLFDGGKTVAK